MADFRTAALSHLSLWLVLRANCRAPKRHFNIEQPSFEPLSGPTRSAHLLCHRSIKPLKINWLLQKRCKVPDHMHMPVRVGVCVSACVTFCLRQINKSILSSALHSAKLTLNFTRKARKLQTQPLAGPFGRFAIPFRVGLVEQALGQHSAKIC